jgi:tRNA modification GTPase
MDIFDTIAAECTAPYKSALSIVRMAGKDSFAILSKMIKKDPALLPCRKAYYCSIYRNKTQEESLIDKGLIILFKGKESFAGEDSVEFYVHGSRIVVGELMETLVSLGARRALGGEFSMKAFYNGKMDLTQAESINQLVNARTERGKDFALSGLAGKGAEKIKEMKDRLNLLSAEIETDIDYPEYDEGKNLLEKIKKVTAPLIKETRSLLSSSKEAKYLFNGIKVAIIGEPNVGKSTLLNKIIGEDKAIVTPIPGTTRDVVEGEKEIDGLIYKFFDTAGIRQKADEIEEIGIKKTYEVTEKADILLVLFEKGPSESDEISKLGIKELVKTKPCIYVSTKRDLTGENEKADISVSKDDKSLDALFALIEKKLDIEKKENEGFTSERDADLLDNFLSTMLSIEEDMKEEMTVDVLEIKLIKATSYLDEILGVSSTMEDIYETVFKNFCVGK